MAVSEYPWAGSAKNVLAMVWHMVASSGCRRVGGTWSGARPSGSAVVVVAAASVVRPDRDEVADEVVQPLVDPLLQVLVLGHHRPVVLLAERRPEEPAVALQPEDGLDERAVVAP